MAEGAAFAPGRRRGVRALGFGCSAGRRGLGSVGFGWVFVGLAWGGSSLGMPQNPNGFVQSKSF